MQPKPKTAKGFKSVMPKVCATCYFHKFVDGSSICEKHDIELGDPGDMNQWFYKCNSWRNEDNPPKRITSKTHA